MKSFQLSTGSTDEAKKATNIGGLIAVFAIIGGCVWLFFTLSSIPSPSSSAPSENRAASAPAPSEQLELVSFNCYKEYGYFHITGEVKNISGKAMESVVAVGNTYTAEGEFVKSADALIEYDPILAGQTSPFKVLATYNPAMTKCSVTFKEFFGGTIPTKRPAAE